MILIRWVLERMLPEVRLRHMHVQYQKWTEGQARSIVAMVNEARGL